MPKVTRETFYDWAGGIISALQPDSLPPNALPRGWNTAFYNFAPGRVSGIGKRRGCGVLNTSAITSTPAILETLQYKRLSGSSYTLYHLCVSDNGRLDKLDTSTFAPTAADSGTAAPFTSGTYYPDYEIANNCVFFVNGNSADQRKFDGTTVSNFGITAPIAPTATDSGVAGVMDLSAAGNYEAAVSYYNTNTGLESSRSPLVTSAAGVVNRKLRVAWTASADAQVTHVRVYIRRPSIGATFVLATSIAIGTITTDLNLANADINALITAAPDTAQNNPPPTVKYLTWHYSRMFAADATNVYYSQIGQPEAFDPTNYFRVNPNDGQQITGLAAVREQLLIFKTRSVYVLIGTDPASWQLRLLTPDIGCISHRSIAIAEGIAYWWSQQGPAAWAGALPELIGQPFLPDEVGPTSINYANLSSVCGGADPLNTRIVWALPGPSQTRNTFMLPYNYRIQRWEANKWDPLDACSLGLIEDGTTQRPYLHIGGYKGRVFRMWNSDTDGARVNNGSSTVFTLSGTLAGSAFTSSVMTDGAAVFDTTGAGLAEVYLTVVNADDPTDYQRRRIASNTGTAITIDTTGSVVFNNVQASGSYNYYVGGADFQLDTAWSDSGAEYTKKRFEFFYLSVISTSGMLSLDIDFAYSYNTTALATQTLSLSASDGTATWDTSLWDNALWPGGAQTSDVRLRCGATGTVWRATFRHLQPNVVPIILGYGMRALVRGDKLG